VVQLDPSSKVLIIGQAPGRRVHESGIPWNDASGQTLRKWLGVDDILFYDPLNFSIVPMSFCYPGKGKSGDLPPLAKCAPLWHSNILEQFISPPLILLIGQYAQKYYLKERSAPSLTETVKNYKSFLPKYFPLPHPSPRNQNWVKVNSWFMDEVVPDLRMMVRNALT
jgi:uracil-DNA glycosylase family 4